jgi:hypothetical protein
MKRRKFISSLIKSVSLLSMIPLMSHVSDEPGEYIDSDISNHGDFDLEEALNMGNDEDPVLQIGRGYYTYDGQQWIGCEVGHKGVVRIVSSNTTRV